MTTEEARAIWLRGLRSGNYPKGKHYLCLDGKYCCLGVACAVFGVPKDDELGEWRETLFSSERKSLPKELQKLLKIPQEGEFVKLITIQGISYSCITAVNDYTNLTLSEIADIIEENFKNNNFGICDI